MALEVVGALVALVLAVLWFPVRRVWRVPLPVEGITLSPWLILIGWRLTGWQRDATEAHERVHQAQQLRAWFPYGWLRWVWRYCTDGECRAAYELEAFAVDVLAYAEHQPIVYGRPASKQYYIGQFARSVSQNRAYTWLGSTMSLSWCEARLTAYVEARESLSQPEETHA